MLLVDANKNMFKMINIKDLHNFRITPEKKCYD